MNEFIKNLCEKIKLSKEAAALTEPYFVSGKANELADRITLHGYGFCEKEFHRSPKTFAPFLLSAVLILAERVYGKYREKDIPDEIYYDTMSDISIWVNTLKREENINGMKNIAWLRNILFFNMFKVGRIQYQFYKTDYILSGVPLLKIKSLTVKNRRNVLNMHIPEGEPLSLSKCRDSLISAQMFFDKYFPEYQYDGFVCDSWLLDPNNTLFMDPQGNILSFPRIFDTVVRTKRNNFEIVKRLWGQNIKNASDIENFPEVTDLQLRTKKYILSGGKTGNGYGTIKK